VPLFRILWPFLAGIIVGIFLPNLQLSMVLIGALFAFALLFHLLQQRALINSVLFIPAFAVAGYTLTVLHTDRLFDDHYSNQNHGEVCTLVGTLSSDAVPRAKSVKAELELDQIILNGSQKSNGTLLVYFENTEEALQLGYGDRVVLKGRVNPIPEPQNPDEFNYKRYMGFHQITHQIYCPVNDWQMTEKGTGLIRTIKDWQHGVMDILQDQGINDRELAILSALLVGYKHYLSADQVNAFASAGAMHVLAVSGLHVGIIFLIAAFVFKPIERFKNGTYVKGVLLLLVLWGYAALTGLSPSVTRAATMFSFVIGAQQFSRHTDIYNTLATSAMALLLFDPFLIVEVGFQLSYLAVLGIVILQPHLYELWETKWWLLDKIWAITTVSVAAQVATFPLGLLYFHQFPNYFLLSNLVVIPAATAILPVGVAMIVFSWVPGLNTVIGMVLFYLVHWLDLFIQWVEKLPGALISGIDISIFETYFIYMIIVTSVVFLITTRYKWLLAFLVTFAIIESFNIGESILQQNQTQAVIYKVKGHEAIDLIDGHNHRFYADTALYSNFDKMRFHIHHHWWDMDLNEPNFSSFSSGIFMHGSKRLLVLDDVVKTFPEMEAADILYITKRTSDQPTQVIENAKPEVVVLSSNLDWKTRSYWIRMLNDMEIAFHDMREEGAYVLNTSSNL